MIRTALAEYKSWLFNSRHLLIIALFLYIRECVGTVLCDYSADMNEKFQFFEPYIAINNSYVLLLIAPLFFLILMSDFPNVGEGYIFVLHRMGKKNWIIEQVIYAFLCSLTVAVMFFAITTLTCADTLKFDESWSDVITKFHIHFPFKRNDPVARLINRDIYNHMYPWEAALHTFTLSVLMMFLYSMILLVGKIYANKYISLAVNILLIGIGGVFRMVGNKIAFLFPSGQAGANLRYEYIARESLVPFWVSYTYFIVLIVALLCVAIIGIKRRKICII